MEDYIKRSKSAIKQRLLRKGITVYFVEYCIDGGMPYMVYTFDKSLIPKAKEAYQKEYIYDGVFDDYITDSCDAIGDAVNIIENRYSSIKGIILNNDEINPPVLKCNEKWEQEYEKECKQEKNKR